MAIVNLATVLSDFTSSIPAEVQSVLTAHICGPQANLHRYTAAAEKAYIGVGPYNPNTAVSYAWPDKTPTGLVDLSSFGLYIDSALLRYFQKLQGVGSAVTCAPSYQNRIIIAGADGFKANGISFPRLAALFDRDVEIGDVVHLNYSGTDFYSTVNALITDVSPSSIASATADPGNSTTQASSSSTTQTAGTINDVGASDSIAGYNGLPTGDINDTYTLTCIQGSTGSDATTALFNVTTASGRDNQLNLAPAAFGSATTVGTRGLTVTWTNTVDDIQVGQVWQVVVNQAFTAPVATSGGTFTGAATCTYIIKVTRGGHYADLANPQITVVNDLGTDSSGPTNVTAAATNVPVGTAGVLVQFSATALNEGDMYYIVATAAGAGAYRTIQLNNSFPTSFNAALDMTLELSIEKNIQVPEDRVSSPPTLNWSISEAGVVVNSGIDGYDSTLTNLGVLFSVPVVSGPSTQMYLSYIEFIDTWVGITGQIQVAAGVDPTTAVTAMLGTVDPCNPLAQAVYFAVLNSNGQVVSFSSVQDQTDLSQWQDAADTLAGLPVFRIVPLTNDPNVITIFQQLCDAQSQDDVGLYKAVLGCLPLNLSVPIINQSLTTDGNVALGTLTANPAAIGTQYTYFTCTSGNAPFVTTGVQVGDVMRFLYSIDAFGNTSYTTFTIAQVVSEDVVILALPGAGAAVGTPQKFEVWRNLSKDQIADNLVTQVATFNDERVAIVFPDLIDVVGGQINGYFLASAIAGLLSTVAPHQGIVSIQITGFSGASRSVNYFGNGQLNLLAAGGVFVVTQDSSGNVVTRNALTTDQTSPATGQEVVVRNDDACLLVVRNRVAAYFGVANVTDSGLLAIQADVEAALQVLETRTFVQLLGDMITDSTLPVVRQSTVSPDTVVVQSTITRPFPVDTLNLTIEFSTTTVSS